MKTLFEIITKEYMIEPNIQCGLFCIMESENISNNEQ